MPHTFSLHKITGYDSPEFSPADYSRFKFGDGRIAEKFGVELANAFIARHLQYNPVDTQMVVLPSPYSFIPTATFSLKTYFVYTLNHWLAEHDYNVVQETKVHRSITYKEDYGELTAAQRIALIGNDSFQIDKEFLKGKTLVFLDDIKITGSHERMINKMISEYNLTNDIYLLYFAELTCKNIPPSIENYFNYFSVKSIFDLHDIINGDGFEINTRLVKYILQNDFQPFEIFINNQSPCFATLLYNMALGNSYHTIKEYKRNLNYIRDNFIYAQYKNLKYGN